jgi:hypothetical protein
VTGWLQWLGAVPLDSLTARADQRLTGLVVGASPVLRASGTCDRAAPGNLGDPAGPAQPCGSYLPISVAAAGAELHDGVGQGLLIGQGALVFSGSFQFTGAVLMSGPLTLRDQARLVGSVAAVDSVTLSGSPSGCRRGSAILSGRSTVVQEPVGRQIAGSA